MTRWLHHWEMEDSATSEEISLKTFLRYHVHSKGSGGGGGGGGGGFTRQTNAASAESPGVVGVGVGCVERTLEAGLALVSHSLKSQHPLCIKPRYLHQPPAPKHASSPLSVEPFTDFNNWTSVMTTTRPGWTLPLAQMSFLDMPDPAPPTRCYVCVTDSWSICQPTYSIRGRHTHTHTHGLSLMICLTAAVSWSSTEDEILLQLAFHDAFNRITLPSQVQIQFPHQRI